MSPRRNQSGLLARVNFPLYTLQMLTSRHILVGGGGGSAKTGIANGFEIFELFYDGNKYVAEEVTRHETGPSVVMNCATHNDGKRTWIAAGQESHCQLYIVSSEVSSVKNGEIPKNTDKSTQNNLKQRKVEDLNDKMLKKEVNGRKKKLNLVVKPNESIQTDFCENINEGSLQRIVRISASGKIMATGGLDGVIRLWKFPHLALVHCLEGHSKEIDDIDFSPDNKTLCTIAKDGKAILWDVVNGKKLQELTWTTQSTAKYLYKRCRYRKTIADSADGHLFMLSNVVIGKEPSYLQLWNTKENLIIKSVPFKETLSALAVSDDGKFVAVGTMFSGSVDIFVAFNLCRTLHVSGVHSMFITGLEFLPTKLDGPSITSNMEAAVVSISVDNRICVHSIPFRHTLPIWLMIVFIVMSIFAAFTLCSYLGI